jgi:hypothetical protein
MADFDMKIEGFKEIEAQLLSLESGEVIDQIQRDGLRAAGAVIKPALVEATPERTDPIYGKSLPKGALKAAIRTRVQIGKDGEPSTEIVDFGKLSYIAHIVDVGHANPTAKKGMKHTPAYPFIREVEDATREEAIEAYTTTVQAGIDKVLSEGK